MTVRMYDKPQNADDLKEDVEEWTSHFAATQVSENAWSYGWDEIDGRNLPLPEDREKCLAWHSKVCQEYYKVRDEKRLAAALLAHPPFNGQP